MLIMLVTMPTITMTMMTLIIMMLVVIVVVIIIIMIVIVVVVVGVIFVVVVIVVAVVIVIVVVVLVGIIVVSVIVVVIVVVTVAVAAQSAAALRSPPDAARFATVAPTRPMQAETRIADDGAAYTRADFIEHYGDHWEIAWEKAWRHIPGGVTQTATAAGPGGSCAPVQVSPQAPPAPTSADAPLPGDATNPSLTGTPGQQHPQSQAAPSDAGAPQPGAVLAVERPWGQHPFFTEVLPSKAQEFERSRPGHPACHTLREAIDSASVALYDLLPLETSTFTAFDVAQALDEAGAIVVAERVARVPSVNRHGKNRADLFVYKDNGDVVRHHPGHNKKQDMKPRRMPRGSLCFHFADAAQQGVGAALHAQPPRMVQLAAHNPPGVDQPGAILDDLLATPEDLQQLCVYDTHMVNWTAVREKAARSSRP